MSGSAQRRRAGKIAIVGFGTIGKRVADAVLGIPELQLAGIAVRRVSPFLAPMLELGVPIYASLGASPGDFVVDCAGTLGQLLGQCDIVLDCTTRGSGRALARLYAQAGVRVIYQGGESADLAEATYCAGIGFASSIAARSVKIESCNTIGLTRLLRCLDSLARLRSARVFLVRSAADPDKCAKGEPNALVASLGESHHGRDIRRIWPDLDVKTLASSAPVNTGHLLNLFAQVEAAVSCRDFVEAMETARRISLMEQGRGSLAELRSFAGRGLRNDCSDVVVWSESVNADKTEVSLSAGIHMEAVVIPDTIDVLLGMIGPENDLEAVMNRTDRIIAGVSLPVTRPAAAAYA